MMMIVIAFLLHMMTSTEIKRREDLVGRRWKYDVILPLLVIVYSTILCSSGDGMFDD
jgi:hypothetical protein